MRRAAVLVGLLVVLVGVLAVLAWRAQPRGTPYEQITGQILLAKSAVERRDASTALHVLSGDYKDDNGFTTPAIAQLVRSWLRDHKNVEVIINSVSPREIPADAKSATLTTNVTVRYDGGQWSGTITTEWQKEPVRRYLFFPGEEWRVRRASGYAGLGTD